MKLGVQVGLDPGHIVLDWYPAPFPKGGGVGAAPNFRPISVLEVENFEIGPEVWGTSGYS